MRDELRERFNSVSLQAVGDERRYLSRFVACARETLCRFNRRIQLLRCRSAEMKLIDRSAELPP